LLSRQNPQTGIIILLLFPCLQSNTASYLCYPFNQPDPSCLLEHSFPPLQPFSLTNNIINHRQHSFKMKFALSFLAFTGASLSASILERQVAAIVGVVTGIEQATSSLDNIVKSFNGNIKALSDASQMVQDTVTKGVTTVSGASSITLTDSVQIQGQVSNLQQTVEDTVNDLISKKSALISAGAGAMVSKSLNDQLAGAKALQMAIGTKVPPEVQSLAQQLSAGINTSLQKGVDAFASVGGMDGSSTSNSNPAVTTTASARPAMFTGAAAPRAILGSLAGLVAIPIVLLAL
jgi:hypothetical protein